MIVMIKMIIFKTVGLVYFFHAFKNNTHVAVSVCVRKDINCKKEQLSFFNFLNSFFRMVQFLNEQGRVGYIINMQLTSVLILQFLKLVSAIFYFSMK